MNRVEVVDSGTLRRLRVQRFVTAVCSLGWAFMGWLVGVNWQMIVDGLERAIK